MLISDAAMSSVQHQSRTPHSALNDLITLKPCNNKILNAASGAELCRELPRFFVIGEPPDLDAIPGAATRQIHAHHARIHTIAPESRSLGLSLLLCAVRGYLQGQTAVAGGD